MNLIRNYSCWISLLILEAEDSLSPHAKFQCGDSAPECAAEQPSVTTAEAYLTGRISGGAAGGMFALEVQLDLAPNYGSE